MAVFGPSRCRPLLDTLHHYLILWSVFLKGGVKAARPRHTPREVAYLQHDIMCLFKVYLKGGDVRPSSCQLCQPWERKKPNFTFSVKLHYSEVLSFLGFFLSALFFFCQECWLLTQPLF